MERKKSLCDKIKKEFWTLSFAKANTTCPTGKKQCGYIDTFQNLLCVNANITCPITNLEIMSENDHPTYHIYSKIRLTDSYNLFFSNAYNNISIITNIVPSASQICAIPNEGALNENQYPLNNFKGPSKCQTKINNSLIDNRYFLLDSDVLSDFYADNGVDVQIKKTP